MSRRTMQPLAPRPSPLAPGAFTFVEVLFAIIILGVGTIMLAGMLPVAIKQSSDTRNDITGRSVCEAGFAYMQTLARTNPAAFPATDDDAGNNVLTGAPVGNNIRGRIVALNHATVEANASLAAHEAIYGSRIFTSDPRFLWTAFYGRASGSNVARVIILATRLQNTEIVDRFSSQTITNENANSDNGPLLAPAEIIEGGALETDKIVFTSAASAEVLSAADTGAFAIVAASENDTGASGDGSRSARNNGRIFRLGARRLDVDNSGRTFDLQTGYDLATADAGPDTKFNTADDIADGSMNELPITDPAGGYPVGSTKVRGNAVQVWIVGRGLQNPAAPAGAGNNYAGLVQDIAVLSADLPLN